jgi:hypothetical protein
MAMSNGNGTLKIKVDIEAQDSASATLNAVNGGLAQLDTELKTVSSEAEGVGRTVNGSVTAVTNGAKQMAAGMEASMGKTNSLLQNVGRVISDMPYGIQGIGNNIQPLAESFRMLSTEVGGSGAAIRAIIAGLGGPAGLLMVGLPIVTSLAIAFAGPLMNAIKGGGDGVDEFKSKLAGLSSYKDFTLQIRIAGLSGIDQLQAKLEALGLQKQYLETGLGLAQALDAARKARGDLYTLKPGAAWTDFSSDQHEFKKADLAVSQAQEASDKFDRWIAAKVAAGIGGTGNKDSDAAMLVKWRPNEYNAKTAAAQVDLNYTNLGIGEASSQLDLAKTKEKEARDKALRQKSEAAGRRADSAEAAAEKKYDTVLKSLDAEKVKLTMSAEAYQAYIEIQKAGVDPASKEADKIRELVHANIDLKKSKDDVANVSKVMNELDDRMKKQTMSAQDYEVYSLIKKAGVATDSKAADEIRGGVKALADESNNLMKGLHDGVVKWVDSLGDSLNNLVWNANASFESVLESFGQMVTKMVIQSAIVKPLSDAVGSFHFAEGGIMTEYGPMPLRKYAAGGIANSPQLAMYGEGSMAEAVVPLPNGRSIPIDWRGGRQAAFTPSSIRVEIVNQGSEQLQVASSTPRVDPEGFVLEVVMRASQTNKGGFRDMLSSAR